MRVVGAAWLAVLCLSSPSAAQRTDVLTIENGDQITGEVKGLDRGVLTYKTDDAGTLSVKWLHVLSLRSQDIFEVEVASGNLYWGPLGVGDQPGIPVVGTQALVLRDVVGITPIEAGFWARTSGYVDAGFNFAKADSRTSLTLDGQMRYRSRKWGSSASYHFHQQEQESADRLRRASLGLDGSYYFGSRFRADGAPMWAGRVFWQATTNDELSLKLRNLIGGGLQRRLRNSSRAEASATLGVLESRETYLDEEDPVHVDHPHDVHRTHRVGARPRGLDGRMKYELLKDVFISVIGSASLDTRPPSETAAKSDYSASFTIGWSWS